VDALDFGTIAVEAHDGEMHLAVGANGATQFTLRLPR